MPPKSAGQIVIQMMETELITVRLIGLTGLYCHRMSAKAKRQLMLGGRKKTAAERLQLKHHPREEFVDSMHVEKGFHPHTHVKFPSMAVKAAMATAALQVEGIRKTDVQRLVYLPDEWIPIFGIPRLRLDITRSADIAKTPDVRTRAYFAEWATEVRIRFTRPALNSQAIIALLANAGIMCGIGDYRQEKGKGNFGTFEYLPGDVPEGLRDVEAQWEAIANPLPQNEESAELLAEYDGEIEGRA